MFEMFRVKPKKAVHKSIRAAFMNVAYEKLFAKSGTWNTDPVGMATLTNEQYLTSLATAGEDATGTDAVLKVDLGQIYEVYNIVFHSGDGGFKSAASNTGVITLQTSIDDSNWTTRGDTQTTVSTAYIPITLGYDGEGIPARYVRILMTPDGTRTLFIKPSEIEVFAS